MEIRPITVGEASTIRLPVLRAGMPPDSAVFDNDDDPGTRHLGAFDGERLVGVATFFAEACPRRPGVRAWRLRGMATLDGMRGRGAGSALVAEGVRIAREDRATVMWCNARVAALSFYERLGFAIEGSEFDLPASGRHFMMSKDLAEPS